MKTYNGWKNYETWNVALWLGNDYILTSAIRGMNSLNQIKSPYRYIVNELKHSMFNSGKSGDGVSWTDPKLDYQALDEMVLELAQ